MENAEQKKRRIMGKQFLIQYINSLNKILLNKISSYDLLSIVETDSFFNKINYDKNYSFKKTILFSERKELFDILKQRSINFNKEYILWIEHANDCGAIKIDSLNYFNYNFPYDVSNNGVITFTQIDYKYKILLDFYEEKNIRFLDIEIFYDIKINNL